MVKVLMFAGAGWVGHKVANQLVQQGYEVTIVHLTMNGRFVGQLNPRIAHILGDVTQESVCRQAVEQVAPEVVIDIHPNPDLIERNYRLLKGRIGHYLHCSSAGVYVPTGKRPASEEAPTHAIEEFGGAFIAKKQVDERAMAHHDDELFPVTIVRPAVILGKEAIPLELWGLRNPVFFEMIRSGLTVRVSKTTNVIMSAVDVDRVAEIFVQAVRHLEKSQGEIYNAVSWSFTHAEYLAAIGQALEAKPLLEYIPTEQVIQEHIDDPKFSLPDYRFFMADIAVSGQKAQKHFDLKPGKVLIENLAESLEGIKSLG